MKLPSSQTTFSFLPVPFFIFLFVLLLFVAGCKKKQDTGAASLPVHEQLMLLLETSARERCELAEARVNVNQVSAEFAAAIKTQEAALAKIKTELAAMRTAFKTAQAEKKESITYAGEPFFEKNFRRLVEQKLFDQTNIEKRIVRYSSQTAVHANNIQDISLKINELNSREEEAKNNINDIVRGRQIADIKPLLERAGRINVAAVTQAAKDIETPNTISTAAEAAAIVKENPQITAEADAFLK